MTAISELDDITRKTIREHMNKIKENGGVDHEQAFQTLILEIVETLEAKGQTDARAILKEFIQDNYKAV